MKITILSAVSRGLFISAVLCLSFAAHSQVSPNKVKPSEKVDLKERERAEKAVGNLAEEWAKFASPPLDHTPVNILNVAPPEILMAPEIEKQREETLALPLRQSLARTTKAAYVEPDVVRSKRGELRVTLEAAYAHNQIGNDPVYLRSFNGKLVGPTLRAKPGDRLCITVKNKMPGERWLPNMMNTLNSFNTLNMHYHGLHVSPNGISDNVLIQIGPEETQEYVLDIPRNHTSGTYWYHPHRHGSTAGTVASGMSGALIIEGGLDDIPEIKAAKERVMVLNQIPYLMKDSPQGKVGLIEAEFADQIFGPGDWPTLGRYTTINGVQLPVIRMRPGQVERWRIVDSGQRETILLKIIRNPAGGTQSPERINFQEIAVDGLALGKMVERLAIELWPGYRSDVLVQAPTTGGEYLLIDDEISGGSTINGTNKPLNYVARIIIEGKTDVMKLPTNQQMERLRLPSIKDGEITGQQEARYGIQFVGGSPIFTINGKSFDMETARQLKLNDVDEWTLVSANDTNISFVTHPFHIHVNPFEVTSIMAPGTSSSGGSELQEQLKDGPVWRDTVKIPGGGYVKMRTRYTDFIGTFVQHCHILDHEDQGMMQLIDIVSNSAPAIAASSPPAPGIGSLAPDFALLDAEGKNYTLAELEGKPSVVFFFKGHGCLHCVRQVAAFTEHYESFSKRGIQVIGVTSDTADALRDALTSFPCPFPILADPEGIAFAKFSCVNAGGTQHGTFVLNASRQVNWRTVGSSPYLTVEDLIEKVLLTDSAVNGWRPAKIPPSSGVDAWNSGRRVKRADFLAGEGADASPPRKEMGASPGNPTTTKPVL